MNRKQPGERSLLTLFRVDRSISGHRINRKLPLNASLGLLTDTDPFTALRTQPPQADSSQILDSWVSKMTLAASGRYFGSTQNPQTSILIHIGDVNKEMSGYPSPIVVQRAHACEK